MLKPVTNNEKLDFTLRVQADKARDEILWVLIDENYHGFVDIWPEIYKRKGKLVLEVKYEKTSSASSSLKNENTVRYHIFPGKGAKVIK